MTSKKNDGRKIDTGGGAYYEGSINTGGGDFVGGNQFNSNSGGATLADLTRLVGEMRLLLPQAKLDDDTQEIIEGRFMEVEKQLSKPEPKKALVLPTLKNMAETLTMAAGAGEAIIKLKPMLDQAIIWAQMLLR